MLACTLFTTLSLFLFLTHESMWVKMDAVTRKALSAMFKLHPNDTTGEILFGDAGQFLHH
jgi:hypothetical protein